MATKDKAKFRATQKRYRDRLRRERAEREGRPLVVQERHGQYDTPTHKSWRAMRQRCLDPTRGNYKHYGGRGIGVCERWRDSFLNFLADMGARPDGHTLDRIDPNGDYEPGNCRWSTHKEQMNNTRGNHILRVDGRALTIAQWGSETGIRAATIWERIRRGWSEKDAVSRPLRGT